MSTKKMSNSPICSLMKPHRSAAKNARNKHLVTTSSPLCRLVPTAPCWDVVLSQIGGLEVNIHIELHRLLIHRFWPNKYQNTYLIAQLVDCSVGFETGGACGQRILSFVLLGSVAIAILGNRGSASASSGPDLRATDESIGAVRRVAQQSSAPRSSGPE